MKRKNGFLGKDILSVDQFSKEDLTFLFRKTTLMKKIVEAGKKSKMLQGKIMTVLFYEPSSRTFGSFISAMQRLGGGIIPLQGMTYSSVAKGETLEDTIRTFECYSDIIVIRHPEVGSAKKAALVSTVPIINAGDGVGEHPTQALLDLFTILSKFKKIDGLKVAFVGDLLNGRTVHSLSKLLAKMGKVEFFFVAPKILRMPQEIKDQLKNRVSIIEAEKLDEVIKKVNVLYITRVQKERFSDLSIYENIKNFYIITKKLMEKARKDLILMHPLPRVGEISTEVDNDSRAVYLTEQMRNGLYVRMALLAATLGKIK
ncbi:MAG: aspartate carbamoyltransferase [Candidatus Levybacteria bacterium RIFCSPHIGHO2_02_FULL_37_10]|nr:MAG: aspartate carbamoyltransferase [Candidatus Levybacteria bacterium RIFCSPHIGHO2_02_FULL_37_10]